MKMQQKAKNYKVLQDMAQNQNAQKLDSVVVNGVLVLVLTHIHCQCDLKQFRHLTTLYFIRNTFYIFLKVKISWC